jgi:hypothetical protein
MGRVKNIQQVQANRRRRLWNEQRETAIRKEQEERCYRQYTPPQIAALEKGKS